MQFGISSFSYGWAVGIKEQSENFTPFTLLERAKEFGVKLVQYGDNLPLHNLNKEQLLTLYKKACDYGINIEVGTRGFTKENCIKYIEIAALLHSPILRMVTDLADYHPSIQEIVELSKGLLPKLEQANVILSFENHDRLKSAEMAKMVKLIDSEYVGICLDMVNSLGAGEGLETVLTNLLPHTVNLHLKDFTIKRVWHQMGFIVEGCPAGQGFLDIPSLIQTVSQIKPNCNAILELWTPPENSDIATIKKEKEWVEQSVQYLKTIEQFC